jgi:hypothetical protein
MVIQQDAWLLIRERGLAPDEIHEIAAQGLGVPEARWRYQENGICLSDVRFYMELRARNLPTLQRMEAWKGRRRLFGLPPVRSAENHVDGVVERDRPTTQAAGPYVGSTGQR